MKVKQYVAFVVYSCTAVTILSCAIPFSHTREDIPAFVEKICESEYGLTVHAWQSGDALWIFSSDLPKGAIPPLEVNQWLKKDPGETKKKLFYVLRELDVERAPLKATYTINAYPEIREIPGSGGWEKDSVLAEQIQTFHRAIANVIWRANLAIDDPFQFIISIIGSPETDYVYYEITFFPDRLKLNTYQISSRQMQERILSISYAHPYAHGDASGSYIEPYNLPGNEFVSTLLQHLMIKDIDEASYTIADDEPEPEKTSLSSVLALTEKRTQTVMPIYRDVHSFREIDVIDTFVEKMKTIPCQGQAEAYPQTFTPKDTISKLFTVSFYYKLAATNLERKDYESVRWYCDKIFTLDPDYPFAHCLLAQVHALQGDSSKAIALYESVLEKHPRLLLALDGLATVYQHTGEYAKAIATYKKISKSHPQWSYPYLMQGQCHYKLKEYSQAVEAYQQASVALEETIDSAKKDFFQYIDMDKVNEGRAMIKKAIGEAYLAMGNHSLAARYLDQSLSFAEDDVSTYINLGFASQQAGDYAQAIEHFQKGLEIIPESAELHSYLGQCYIELGQYEKGRELYKQALDYCETDEIASVIHFYIGLSYAKEGRYADAVQSYETALERDQSNYNAHTNSGFAYLNLKEYDAAIISFKRAIEYNAQIADAYRGIGLCYFYRERYSDARPYFEKAKQLFQEHGESEGALEMQSYLNNIPE